MRRLAYSFRTGVGADAMFRAGICIRTAGHVEHDFCTRQYALVYAPEGGMVYCQGESSYEVGPGMAVQRFPNVTHSLRFTENAVNYYVGVPAEVHQLLTLTGISQPGPVLNVGLDHDLIPRIRAIIDELCRQSESNLMLTLNTMQELITDIHRYAREFNRTEQSDWLDEARYILSHGFESRLDIPAAAQRLGMSYNTFRKRFKEQVGVSPGDYRIRKRIERACQLLLGEDLQAKEIPDMLGYYDYYAFSAQFKRIMGMSPRAFRRGE